MRCACNSIRTFSSATLKRDLLSGGTRSEACVEMIEHLGSLLRLSLESKDRKEGFLWWKRWAFLEHYVAIQKIRFGDHLRIETHIARK